MTEPRTGNPLLPRAPRTVRSVLPVLVWLPRYAWRANLPADLVAGIALAALLVPESMGYAGVAGVPPQVGLYAALGAVLAYALTGGTSILVVGPASAVAALSASVIGAFDGRADPVPLAAALAITSGLILVAAGALRLGWIVNFISRPVLHAFVAGLSISIIVGQLDGLLGVEVTADSAVARLLDIVTRVGDWHPLTTAIGVAAVVCLLVLERYARRIPAAVIVVAIGIVVAVAFGLDARGVAVVGEIPQGLPRIAIPDLSGTRWLELFAGGTALLLVGFSEGYAAASAVSARTGEEVDADQELVGAGVANVASGLLGGLAVSGSLSKSAASQAAGARSQVANLAGGLVVLATLLFLGPVFRYLPEPVLAAVVIAAVLPSASPRRVLDLWQVNRLDFTAGAVTFALVLVWETLPAMMVGVALSLAFVVRRASFPDVVELVPVDGVFRNAAEAGTAAAPAGSAEDRVAVLRFEAPLVYANADRLGLATRTLIGRRSGLERVVLDAEMISDLDSSGAEVLEALDDDLAAHGIALHLARMHHHARAQLERSRMRDRFHDRMHASVHEATGDGPGAPGATDGG